MFLWHFYEALLALTPLPNPTIKTNQFVQLTVQI